MNFDDELMSIVGTGSPDDELESLDPNPDPPYPDDDNQGDDNPDYPDDDNQGDDNPDCPDDQDSPQDDEQVLIPVSEPEVTEVIEYDNIPESNLQESTADADFGIKNLVSKFGNTVDIIIQNQSKDREQLEGAIGYFESEVKEARKNGQKISPAMVEAWTKLLQTKTEVNTNASRVLDSVARLISAGKGNDLIINLNQSKSASDIDLKSILDQPTYDDEK